MCNVILLKSFFHFLCLSLALIFLFSMFFLYIYWMQPRETSNCWKIKENIASNRRVYVYIISRVCAHACLGRCHRSRCADLIAHVFWVCIIFVVVVVFFWHELRHSKQITKFGMDWIWAWLKHIHWKTSHTANTHIESKWVKKGKREIGTIFIFNENNHRHRIKSESKESSVFYYCLRIEQKNAKI